MKITVTINYSINDYDDQQQQKQKTACLLFLVMEGRTKKNRPTQLENRCLLFFEEERKNKEKPSNSIRKQMFHFFW
jgi:hypothetical protein